RAMLKVPIPPDEAEHEPDALRTWNGDGAVRLLELDPSGAMLLELADPGTPLADHPDATEAARIGGEALRSLHRAPPTDEPIDRLEDVCATWAILARERSRTLGRPEDAA